MKKLLILILWLISISLNAATYYVATNGNDAVNGDFTHPWLTWNKAFQTAVAGDTVYFRGGVYPKYPATNFGMNITTSGTHNHPICFFNYPGEEPIMDCSNFTPTAQNFVFYLHGTKEAGIQNVKFKGLTIRNVKQITNGVAVAIIGWHIKHLEFENMKVYNVDGSGFSLGSWDSVWFKNCDVWNVCDWNMTAGYGQTGTPGQNGVGFQGYNYVAQEDYSGQAINSYIRFEGCRTWKFSDNGFECGSSGYREWVNCWAFLGGRLYGDGDGWKLCFMPVSETRRTDQGVIRNCIGAYNGCYGFGVNNAIGSSEFQAQNVRLINNTAYHNGYNHALLYWEYDFGTGFWGYTFHGALGTPNGAYRNNIAYANEYAAETISPFGTYYHDHNTWDIPITVTANDFLSLDSTGLSRKRGVISPGVEDWSLPDLDFLKLSPTSHLIDRGVNVGLPYSGATPDLGWAEYQSGIPTVKKQIKNVKDKDNKHLIINQ